MLIFFWNEKKEKLVHIPMYFYVLAGRACTAFKRRAGSGEGREKLFPVRERQSEHFLGNH